MDIEDENMASSLAQDPRKASAASVLREIKSIVRSMLPAEIAEPHLYVIGQGARDLLSFSICTGILVSGRRPSLADLPVGHLLTLSPERVASMCTKCKPWLCREESARRIGLFQSHAVSLGYWPSAGVEAWNWSLHSSWRAFEPSIACISCPLHFALEIEFAKLLRFRCGD